MLGGLGRNDLRFRRQLGLRCQGWFNLNFRFLRWLWWTGLLVGKLICGAFRFLSFFLDIRELSFIGKGGRWLLPWETWKTIPGSTQPISIPPVSQLNICERKRQNKRAEGEKHQWIYTNLPSPHLIILMCQRCHMMPSHKKTNIPPWTKCLYKN